MEALARINDTQWVQFLASLQKVKVRGVNFSQKKK